MVLILNDNPLQSCWVLYLGSRLLQIGGSWSAHAPLSFCLQIMAQFMCYCLCFSDAIVELHIILDENCSMTFSWFVIKAY